MSLKSRDTDHAKQPAEECQLLSESLADLLKERSSSSLSLNGLLGRTQGRGYYLVIILLCLPFLIPVSLPGLSTVLGSIIAVTAFGLAVGKTPRLPRFLGERDLPGNVRERVLGGSIAFLRIVEKIARPRRTAWMASPPAHFLNCLFLLLLALLLALPLPSPPFFFSNSIPSYAIVLLAASMMEQDGALIWIGYLLLLGNVVFFALIGEVVLQLLLRLFHVVSQIWPGL